MLIRNGSNHCSSLNIKSSPVDLYVLVSVGVLSRQVGTSSEHHLIDIKYEGILRQCFTQLWQHHFKLILQVPLLLPVEDLGEFDHFILDTMLLVQVTKLTFCHVLPRILLVEEFCSFTKAVSCPLSQVSLVSEEPYMIW